MTDDATMPERSKGSGESPERRRRQIKLNDEQRQYVVRRLAARDAPSADPRSGVQRTVRHRDQPTDDRILRSDAQSAMIEDKAK